jgi:hypothetical protein
MVVTGGMYLPRRPALLFSSAQAGGVEMWSYTAQVVTGVVVLVLYAGLMLFAASAYVRRANARWLTAHQDALRGRVTIETSDPGLPAEAKFAGVAINLLVPPAADGSRDGDRGRGTWWSPGGWIGSHEIAEWVRLHEAQRLEVWRLPDSAVRARFARAMGQLEELSPIRQNAWQGRWTDLQAASEVAGDDDESMRRTWRAELSQLLAELFNARDSTYNQLVSLYGKAGWLVLAAYLPVMALLTAGYGAILLAGFLGGLISRMQRVVYGPGRPTAYGTSWVPLFVAPLLGALAAWAGLHLLTLLQAVGIVDLSSIISADETFRDIPPVPVLGLAVLLGFSERFFNQLGDQAEKVIAGDADRGSAAAAGSPTPSFRQRPGGGDGQRQAPDTERRAEETTRTSDAASGDSRKTEGVG